MTLTQACQIVITDPEYNSYPETQTEKRIPRIGQLNVTTAHFILCYNVDVEKQIKDRHKRRKSLAKTSIRKQK